MARRDHPGVAPTRIGPELGVALQQHHVVAVLHQLVGGGDTDHPAPHDQHPHPVPLGFP